jgi:hypothetical protein
MCLVIEIHTFKAGQHKIFLRLIASAKILNPDTILQSEFYILINNTKKAMCLPQMNGMDYIFNVSKRKDKI